MSTTTAPASPWHGAQIHTRRQAHHTIKQTLIGIKEMGICNRMHLGYTLTMNYQPTFERRFYALLKAVDPQPRCTSGQEAHDLLLKHWVLICEMNGLSKVQVECMKSRYLSTVHGWHNLGKNPCNWDSKTSPGVRIYLHDDGLIVMLRINDGDKQEILFLK